LVEAHDSALAEAARNGLYCEVLAHELEVEEKDGVVCIQAALNDPAHATMLVHEMPVIKQKPRVCMCESNKAGGGEDQKDKDHEEEDEKDEDQNGEDHLDLPCLLSLILLFLRCTPQFQSCHSFAQAEDQ
jgi:hypothetical protein